MSRSSVSQQQYHSSTVCALIIQTEATRTWPTAAISSPSFIPLHPRLLPHGNSSLALLHAISPSIVSASITPSSSPSTIAKFGPLRHMRPLMVKREVIQPARVHRYIVAPLDDDAYLPRHTPPATSRTPRPGQGGSAPSPQGKGTTSMCECPHRRSTFICVQSINAFPTAYSVLLLTFATVSCRSSSATVECERGLHTSDAAAAGDGHTA